MEKQEVQLLVSASGQPVYKIETDLGMAQGTLAKAVSGSRSLPFKWEDKLRGYVMDQGKTKSAETPIKSVVEVQPGSDNTALEILLGKEVLRLSGKYRVHHKTFLSFAAEKWQAEVDGTYDMAEKIINKSSFKELGECKYSWNWFVNRFKELELDEEYRECAEQIKASNLTENQKNALLKQMRQGSL